MRAGPPASELVLKRTVGAGDSLTCEANPGHLFHLLMAANAPDPLIACGLDRSFISLPCNVCYSCATQPCTVRSSTTVPDESLRPTRADTECEINGQF